MADAQVEGDFAVCSLVLSARLSIVKLRLTSFGQKKSEIQGNWTSVAYS